MSAPGTPSTATELVCTWKPSCTWATSRMNTVRPLTGADREGVDGLDRIGAVVHRDEVIARADLHVPGGQDDVLVLQRIAHVRRRQAARLQRRRIEVGHDDARLAAVGIRHLGAVHDGERRTDDVLAEVVEPRVRQRAAGETQLDDRHVGGAVADHQRRRDVRRHVLQHHQRAAAELRDGAGDIGPLVQVDLLDPHALVARRLDARDVIDQGGELALVQREDAVLHVLGAHAGVGPHDADHRDVDLAGRCRSACAALRPPRAGHQDQGRHHGVGARENVADDGHALERCGRCG